MSGADEAEGRSPADNVERWPSFELSCMVQRYDDRPDHCTIYPSELDHEAALTRWISADAGDFVSLDELR